MTTNPPSPYMHRDLQGNDTTQRSTNWQVRARQAVNPYSPGQGLTRRPDVVIVHDPTLPPTQDNIAQIYELKFRDKENLSQLSEYQRIAGGEPTRAIVLDPDKCDCQDKKKKEQLERKLQDSANQKDIDNIMRRNRINRWIGDMGGGSVGPLPVPGGIPIIP